MFIEIIIIREIPTYTSQEYSYINCTEVKVGILKYILDLFLTYEMSPKNYLKLSRNLERQSSVQDSNSDPPVWKVNALLTELKCNYTFSSHSNFT